MKTWYPWALMVIGLLAAGVSLEKASAAERSIHGLEDDYAHASRRIDELESQVEDLESKIETLESDVQEKADEDDLRAVDDRVSDLEDR